MVDTFADNIKQIRQETGARLVVIGEAHNEVNTIQHMRESLPSLKAQGINTLYLEIHADLQPIVDKAVKGDEKAQRDLRFFAEGAGWGGYGGTEGAQQHYDLIMEANKAGIRVKCIDGETSNFAMMMHDDLKEISGKVESRLAISNPLMARNIKRLDDGQGALMLVGEFHTYKTDENPHARYVNKHEVFRSNHGGIDQQLTALGIPSASVDIDHDLDGDYSIKKQTVDKDGDLQADYTLLSPYPEISSPRDWHISTAYRGVWTLLKGNLDVASAQAEIAGDKQTAKICNDAALKVAALPQLLDSPAFLKMDTEAQEKKLKQTIKDLSKPIEDSLERINDDVLRNSIAKIYSNNLLMTDYTRDASIRVLVGDNQDLHLSGAEQMWKRDPMPLAGEKTGLGKNFDQALSSTTPLDRPQTKTDTDAAPQQNTSPSRQQRQSYDYQ